MLFSKDTVVIDTAYSSKPTSRHCEDELLLFSEGAQVRGDE